MTKMMTIYYCLFHTELPPERYWKGTWIPGGARARVCMCVCVCGGGGGGEGGVYLTLDCNHQGDSALRWAAIRVILMFH